MNPQSSIRALVYVLGTIAALMAVAFLSLIVWRSYAWNHVKYPRGLLANPSDWPIPLQDVIPQLQQAGALPSRVEVYQLHDNDLDWAMLRFPAQGSNLSKFSTYQALSPVPATDDLVRKFWEQMPQAWTPVGNPATSTYSATAAWRTGDEGDRYFVCENPADPMIYVLYYFNF